MFSHPCKKLLVASLTLALAGLFAPVEAQNVKGLNDNNAAAQPAPPPGEGSTEFLIEPEAQIKGDNIKQQTYRSEPAGQNRNWNLDIGRFQPPINDDPNQLAEDLDNNNYSGIRLRLPFRGRTGQ